MKFQRNVRIFRGQLDAAPVAGVFFLLLLFLLLHSSLVYHPGLPIALEVESTSARDSAEQTVKIDSKDRIFYRNASFQEPAFQKRVREEIAKGKAPKLITIRTEPGSRTALIQSLKLFGDEVGVRMQVQKTGLELPEGFDLPGTAGAQLVVAVNHNEKLYFQNQQVNSLADLQKELEQARALVKEKLTLVIDADKAVTYEFILELAQLATGARFDQVLLATRPKLLPLPAKPAAAQ
jgi:biopolymer transport protein ExbD